MVALEGRAWSIEQDSASQLLVYKASVLLYHLRSTGFDVSQAGIYIVS